MLGRDKRIAEIRKGLHKAYLPYFDALCLELPPDWFPYSGKRSFVEQDALYLQGRDPKTLAPLRKDHKGIVTNARAGFSPHNWGMATDWTLFNQEGKPIWKHDQWEEYGEIVEKIGLVWGGDWNNNNKKDKNDFDRPHNELPILPPWRKVGEFYFNSQKNEQATIEFILKNRI